MPDPAACWAASETPCCRLEKLPSLLLPFCKEHTGAQARTRAELAECKGPLDRSALPFADDAVKNIDR